jgi:hypothetical protein
VCVSVGPAEPAELQTVFDPKADMSGFEILRGRSRRAAHSWSAGNSNSEFAGQIGRVGPTECV